MRRLLGRVDAHEVATLRAGAALAASATLVLPATGCALFAGGFWSGSLDRRIEGASGRSGLTTLTALTAAASAATSTSIAAALTLTLTLTLTLALAGRRLAVG